MAGSLSNIFGRDEFIASRTGGIDDYEVDRQKIRSLRLTYTGRNAAGNRIWTDNQGHQYYARDLAKHNGDGTPKLAGRDTSGSEDDDRDMSYRAGSYGGDYTTAWGGGDTGASSYPNAPDNYRYNNNPSEDILSKWQVTNSKRTVTNPRDLQSTRPLPDDSWDDIPETAGRGKYSKTSVREAAERMPCVEAAKAEGREVRLQYNHSVNGHKKQTDQLLCPGSRREGRPILVRFTGDLHSDGSQAAGRKAQLKASCEEEHRATTTTRTGTGTDSAADCRPCCDDCDDDKEEKQAAKERLKEKYLEQQTIRNRVVDKRNVTDKSQVTRGKANNNPYYDSSSKNQLDKGSEPDRRALSWLPYSNWGEPARTIPVARIDNLRNNQRSAIIPSKPASNERIFRNTHFVELHKPEVRIAKRTTGKTFTQIAKQMDRVGSTEYTVNLQIYETTSDVAKIQYFAGNMLAPTDVRTQGYTVDNGRILPNGRSSKTYYFAQNSNNNSWIAGFGDPPANSKVGFGGGIPLVVNGLPFGNDRKFDAAGGLVQQSNAGYRDQNRTNVGKTIIAFKNGGDFLIVVQEDGADGMTLDEIRDILIAQGYNNALSYDGSTSATLVREKYIVTMPSSRKDNSIPIGATFTINDEY